jgi:hypothetical protein
MARKSKYTRELLEPIVKQSTSLSQVMKTLGLNPNAGGSNKLMNSRIQTFGLDTNHFKGFAWNKGESAASNESVATYVAKQ